jgi:hypothetical protein
MALQISMRSCVPLALTPNSDRRTMRVWI